MTSHDAGSAWFAGLDPAETDGAVTAIQNGSAAEPSEWAEAAVESGVVDDESEYYDWLHRATVTASTQAVAERERADDQQLIHAIRALDDCERVTNELTERVAEWAGTHDSDATIDTEYVHDLTERDPEDPLERQVVALAERVAALDDQATELRTFVERWTPDVAPNLAALAGPELAARLISLAGGLEALAKKPSGTLQVLGAEDALFAHLRGGASSPKHGVIYLHEAVRGTSPNHRGSAARALAGKLSIAARVDHYSGERKPELADQLGDRIERIRARGSE